MKSEVMEKLIPIGVSTLVMAAMGMLFTSPSWVPEKFHTHDNASDEKVAAQLVKENGVCEMERYASALHLNKWLERGYVVLDKDVVVGGSQRIKLMTKVPCDPYGQPIPVDD